MSKKLTFAFCEVTDPAVTRAITTIAACWGIAVEAQGEPKGAGALIIGEGCTTEVRTAVMQRDISALIFAGSGTPVSTGSVQKVKFTSHAALPCALRGSALPVTESAGDLGPSFAELEDVAHVAGRPIWRLAAWSGGKTLVVATAPPRLEKEQRLAEIFNGETFLHALPVWLFFQALSLSAGWQPPPLRACLMVDDPNLHHVSYGCIGYRSVVATARQQPFHVAFATVPLDGWWVSSAAARTFHDHPDVLSLLVHGNDHRRGELARSLSQAQRVRLVAQSLARTAATEKKSGLRIDRIMAPPHGVCTAEMMAALWRGGYDGLTTNRWSLWKDSPPATLPEDFGVRPADWLAGGLPVTGRFRFKSSICQNEIHLAALLGQPILPYGHHKDFDEDMKEVRQTVGMINAVGDVQWMNMQKIYETNFEHRIEGDTFHIRPFSRRVKGVLPAGTKHLQIEFPASTSGGVPEFVVTSPEPTSRTKYQSGEPIILGEGSHFEMRFTYTPPPAPLSSGSDWAWKPAILLKRLATETRDRLQG